MTGSFGQLDSRPFRGRPAAFAATVLLAAAVLAVWAAVVQLTEHRWPAFTEPLRMGGAESWDSILGWSVGIGLGVLGVVSIALALVPSRPRSIPLRWERAPHMRDGAAFLTRRGLARLATAEAQSIDGVDQVSAVAGSRRVRVTVRTGLVDTHGLQDQLRTALTRRLEAAGVAVMPAITVRAVRREVRG